MNSQRFLNKVAVITAATEGIGLAIAERLAREGASIVISSRQQKNVENAITKLTNCGINHNKIASCVCHVARASDRQRLIDTVMEKFGRVDILVNNAGINPVACDILDVSDETWDKLFDVNVKAAFQLTKLIVPHMEANGGGNIIFNASIAGYLTPHPIAAYGITKTTLLGLSRALSTSLASRNIRVNCISPGVIETKMSRMLWDQKSADGPNVFENPMQRYGSVDECAAVVAFLASDDASYITGENIVMAGGTYSRL